MIKDSLIVHKIHKPSVKSGSFDHKQRCGDEDDGTLEEFKHWSSRAPMTKNDDRQNMEKSSPRDRGPTKGIKTANVSLKQLERMTHGNPNRFKQLRSALTNLRLRDRDSSSISKRFGVCPSMSNNCEASPTP
jgi:hypothetical protein